ncbi:MAG: tail fiber domain-containing protein, partial [Bacteroidota bacterium]|nr:tail fiber domain-containing protein [Bacteroidota bacterium]
MKTQSLIIMVILMCFSVSTMAQQNGTERLGINTHKYSRLKTQGNNPLVQNFFNSKSLGVYTSDIYPKSMLEVNTTSDYTQFFHPDIANRGEVFRTVGPANVTNYWRMFTGNSEKASLYVPAGSQDLIIESRMLGSNIRFNIYPNIQRAILTDGKGQGHLGVGNNFSDPQHMIHVHTTPILGGQDPFPAYTGYSNSNTDATINDGFITGIEPDGTARINQQENHNLEIYTGAANLSHTRMLIRGEAGTTQGFVGIGQDFNDPQSLLHIDASLDLTGEVFRTNTRNNNTFWRMDVTHNERGNVFSMVNAPEAIDNDNFGIQASENDITFHTQPLASNGIGEERMRIVGVDRPFGSVPYTVEAGNVGIITHNPLSRLHIGGDVVDWAIGGYREWMDIGTLYHSYEDDGWDNMYVGLQRHADNQHDAIINWGNDPSMNQAWGDRLRFVFTANENIVPPVTASDSLGLEIARMVSDGNDGRMGIGDFLTINEDPTHTLDVKGNARIRELPEGDFDSVLVINGDGVLHWSTDFSTGEVLGNPCDDTIPATNPLAEDWEIALEHNNFVFTGQGDDTDRVGIGTNCSPDAKLDVLINSGEIGSTAINAVTSNGSIFQTGIRSLSTTSVDNILGIGAEGIANFSNINIGIRGIAEHAEPFIMDASYNIGGNFYADDGHWNFGIYSSVPDTTEDYFAGYFEGNVNVEGALTVYGDEVSVSDQQFKQNINDYTGALDKVRELNPVTFNFDTASYDLNFPGGMQYGLISQEVEQVIPELVSNGVIPPKVDSAGNI